MNQNSTFKGQDKSLRKKMIIDTAVSVFYRKGYMAATLDDIAGELGLTRPALYHYFSSKENLLSQVYLQKLTNFYKVIDEIADMDLPPVEKIKALVRQHIMELAYKNRDLYIFFIRDVRYLPQKDFLAVQKAKLKHLKRIVKTIKDGIAQGYFRQVNPTLAADAIIGMCAWMVDWFDPENDSFGFEEVAEQFTTFVEKGLARTELDDGKLCIRKDSEGTMDHKLRKEEIYRELRMHQEKTAALIEELETLS